MGIYFPSAMVGLKGVKVERIDYDPIKNNNTIHLFPDLRHTPVCSDCGEGTFDVKDIHYRLVRDVDLLTSNSWLKVGIRKLRCPNCGQRMEKLSFVDKGSRVSKRLEKQVYLMCQFTTIRDVANYFGLDWKTVKAIDKKYLKAELEPPNYDNLHLLAVDEISLKKGHNYLTLVLNLENGEVVWVGEGHEKESLDKFYHELNESQKAAISAVAMDMWKAYETSTRGSLPNAKIVFDKFHLVKNYQKSIDRVRNDTYSNATIEQKEVIKGSKYLLLKKKKT